MIWYITIFFTLHVLFPTKTQVFSLILFCDPCRYCKIHFSRLTWEIGNVITLNHSGVMSIAFHTSSCYTKSFAAKQYSIKLIIKLKSSNYFRFIFLFFSGQDNLFFLLLLEIAGNGFWQFLDKKSHIFRQIFQETC